MIGLCNYTWDARCHGFDSIPTNQYIFIMISCYAALMKKEIKAKIGSEGHKDIWTVKYKGQRQLSWFRNKRMELKPCYTTEGIKGESDSAQYEKRYK